MCIRNTWYFFSTFLMSAHPTNSYYSLKQASIQIKPAHWTPVDMFVMNTTPALTCAVTGGPSLTVITRNTCLDSSPLSCQQVELPSSSLFTKQISAMGLEALILWPESQDIIERGRDGSAGWIKGDLCARCQHKVGFSLSMSGRWEKGCTLMD